MAMAAPLFSRASSCCAALILSGCVASAPALPPDTTSANAATHAKLEDFSSADAALTCADINAEGASIESRMQADTGKVEGNRTRNQIAGYFGALYLVPLLAMEPNDPEKKDIAKLYARRDILIKLSVVKSCPMPIKTAS
jgi:hypothetical protein